MDDFDFVAIGGGNTGLASASRIARLAAGLELVRRAREHGISNGEVAIDWSRALAAPLVASPVVFPWYLAPLVPVLALHPRALPLIWGPSPSRSRTR